MEDSVINAVVIFADARGFTPWAEKHDVFPFIDEFGRELQKLLIGNFNDFIVSDLGDGAMIIKEINELTTEISLKKLIIDLIKRIDKLDKDFHGLCKKLAFKHGCKIPLRLGWGITKGAIKKYDDHYIGADINKSSRLCGIARPFGIVIDRDDFSILPKFPNSIDISFYKQERMLKGIPDKIEVWTTKEIANEFITREYLRQTPEVHVAGICLKNIGGTIYALIAKRNSNRKLFPNLYEGCGGQLAENETFVAGVKRHYALELNIVVDVIEDIHKFYYIQQPNVPVIPGICFLCLHRKDDPHSENHEPVKWVSEDDLKRMPEEAFIKGLKNDFLEFMRQYKVMFS